MDFIPENDQNIERNVTEESEVVPGDFSEESELQNSDTISVENGRSSHVQELNSVIADTKIETITEKDVVKIDEKPIIDNVKEAEGEESSLKNEEKDSNMENSSFNIDTSSKVDEVKELINPSGASNDEVITPEERREEWIDLLGNGLLLKKIIKAGNADGSHPSAGQEVCVKCEGTLPDGETIDVKDELKFIIGDGDVITAFDLCIPTMVAMEVCELKVAPRFAYGTFGREDDDEGDVPPDCDIIYTLELLTVNNGPEITVLTDEQRITISDSKRERGNDLFRREEYSLAVHSYNRALKYLGSSQSQEIIELKIKCWNNISASHLKLQEYVAAIQTCDSVLAIDPQNVKALFRKGKVLHAQGEYEGSIELLRKANSLDPENKLVRRELYIVRQKCGESRQKERDMYQRMVGGLADDSTTPGNNNNTFFTWPVVVGITGVALGAVIVAVLMTRH